MFHSLSILLWKNCIFSFPKWYYSPDTWVLNFFDMFSVIIFLNWLRILWKQISSFWIAPHPPVCNVLRISCRFSNFPPVHLGISCIPEHVITTVHPFDGRSNFSRKLPCSLNISRVSVGIHPSGSVVILPVLIAFEEVSLTVSLPDKDRV